MTSQRRRTGAVKCELVQHAHTALLQRIGAVLTSAMVVVAKQEAGDERVEQSVVLEHELLVGVRDGHHGDAAVGGLHLQRGRHVSVM